jgi:hypothetical protein
MNSTISSLKRVGVASLTPSGGNGATICPARISKTFSGDTYHHRKVGSLDAVTDKTRASKKKSEVGAPNKKASIKLSLTRSKSPTHYTMV